MENIARWCISQFFQGHISSKEIQENSWTHSAETWDRNTRIQIVTPEKATVTWKQEQDLISGFFLNRTFGFQEKA